MTTKTVQQDDVSRLVDEIQDGYQARRERLGLTGRKPTPTVYSDNAAEARLAWAVFRLVVIWTGVGVALGCIIGRVWL